MVVWALLGVAMANSSLDWRNETAWMGQQGNGSIGIWEVDYTLTDRFAISVIPAPYIVGLINLDTRFRIVQTDTVEWVANVGMMRFSVDRFLPESMTDWLTLGVYMVPWSTTVTHRTPEWSLTAKVLHNQFGADGGNSQSLNTDVETVVGTTNTHLRLTVGRTLGARWSVWGIYNRLLSQGIVGQNYVSYPFASGGQVEVFTNASSDVANFTGNSIGGRLRASFGDVTVTSGLDVGKVPIYLVGGVLPTPIALPSFDVQYSW